MGDGAPSRGRPPGGPEAWREPRLVRALLDALPAALVVLGPDDEVRLSNPAAEELGLLDGDRLASAEVRAVVRLARRSGGAQDRDLTLPARIPTPLRSAPPGTTGPDVHIRVLPLGSGDVACIIEDITAVRRVEAVRRDFVANVGHELKTPVGALALLAEAIADASGDPGTVARFARRMSREVERLGKLVQEVIELSRLQGEVPGTRTDLVWPLELVAEAVDRTRLAAEARGIAVLARAGEGVSSAGPSVAGDEGQLTTALVNLIDNAIAYSPPGTQVTVGVTARAGWLEISVTDEGIGIAPADQERIFERFYRVDPARSRETGGTGLGLAIVKHVATNHQGAVTVWSALGAGATFTLRLPTTPGEDPPP